MSEYEELVDAVDARVSSRASVLAIWVGAVLTLGAWIAGYFIFPRGARDESADEAEATALEVEETASDH